MPKYILVTSMIVSILGATQSDQSSQSSQHLLTRACAKLATAIPAAGISVISGDYWYSNKGMKHVPYRDVAFGATVLAGLLAGWLVIDGMADMGDYLASSSDDDI